MPRVEPFAGLRYAAPSAELERLISPPYDVIDPDEQARLQATSPHHAVHLELPSDAPGQPGSRYRLAAERLADWRRTAVLRADPRPAYYLSETHFGHAGATFVRRDLLASVAVEPWSAGSVLPHEHTLSGPKQDRLELLRNTHLNASPIWLLHRQPLPALEQTWDAAAATRPTLDFTWRAERHRIWLIDAPPSVEAVRAAFADAGPLYIADGHHRYETSLAFCAEAGSSVPGADGILAAITWAADPGLLVLPTHRLLHRLEGAPRLEDVETRWSDVFSIQRYPVREDVPAEQIDVLMRHLADAGRLGHAFGVFGLEHRDLFSLLALRGGTPPPDALPAERSTAWKSLDVSLLHTLLIDRLIAEAGAEREQVLSYTRDPYAAFEAVQDGNAAAAFLLNPTPVTSVLDVADAHDRMPQKSTYFYPKPPAGLVMRDLER